MEEQEQALVLKVWLEVERIVTKRPLKWNPRPRKPLAVLCLLGGSKHSFPCLPLGT